MNTKDIIKDLKHLEYIFDFSNLKRNHELFSIENKKVLGEFRIETPQKIYIVGLFVWEVECNRLNVGRIVNLNWKLFLNLNQNVLCLKTIKIV